jgi:hypothetical protein
MGFGIHAKIYFCKKMISFIIFTTHLDMYNHDIKAMHAFQLTIESFYKFMQKSKNVSLILLCWLLFVRFALRLLTHTILQKYNLSLSIYIIIHK